MWNILHSFLYKLSNQGTLFLIFVSMIVENSLPCKFEGLIASCNKDVANIPLQISARINHCHSPLDISFLIKSPRHYRLGDRAEPLYWEYTYVTTNKEESKEIFGFDHRIFFCLYAEEKIFNNNSKRESVISIEAFFKVKNTNQTNYDLINQNVTIAYRDDCLFFERDNHITKIAIAMSVAVILVFVSGISVFLFIRNRKLRIQMQDEERQDLVKNMTPQSKSKRKSKKATHLNTSDSIKYVVTKNDSKDEAHELQIYVSTTTGLEKVEFPPDKGNKEDPKSIDKDDKMQIIST